MKEEDIPGMRWNEETERPEYYLLFPEEIVYQAYTEGFINWNSYQKAIEKIRSNKNGSWMFAKGNLQDTL